MKVMIDDCLSPDLNSVGKGAATGQQTERLAMESNYFSGLIRINDRVRGETHAATECRLKDHLHHPLSQKERMSRRRRSWSSLFLMLGHVDGRGTHQGVNRWHRAPQSASLSVCLSHTGCSISSPGLRCLNCPSAHPVSPPVLVLLPTLSMFSLPLNCGPSHHGGDPAATSLVADRRLSLLSFGYTVVFRSLFSCASRSL